MGKRKLLVFPVIFEGGASNLLCAILLQQFDGIPVGQQYFYWVIKYLDTGQLDYPYFFDHNLLSAIKNEEDTYRMFYDCMDKRTEKSFYPLYLVPCFDITVWSKTSSFLKRFYNYGAKTIDIRFVLWIRNPIDAIYKVRRASDTKTVVGRALAHFKMLEEIKEWIPQDKQITIRYEDFCNGKDSWAGELEDFLDLAKGDLSLSHIYPNPTGKWMSDIDFFRKIGSIDLTELNRVSEKYGYPKITMNHFHLRVLSGKLKKLKYSLRRSIFYFKDNVFDAAEVNPIPIRIPRIFGKIVGKLNKYYNKIANNEQRNYNYTKSFTFKYYEQIEPKNPKYNNYTPGGIKN